MSRIDTSIQGINVSITLPGSDNCQPRQLATLMSGGSIEVAAQLRTAQDSSAPGLWYCAGDQWPGNIVIVTLCWPCTGALHVSGGSGTLWCMTMVWCPPVSTLHWMVSAYGERMRTVLCSGEQLCWAGRGHWVHSPQLLLCFVSEHWLLWLWPTLHTNMVTPQDHWPLTPASTDIDPSHTLIRWLLS